jgi:hypothetical protein
MSTTRRDPLHRERDGVRAFTAMAALAGLLLAAPTRARADDNMLRGPYPFTKDNAVSAHILLAAGGNNTPGGTKLAGDYAFRLRGPAWLDLQLNYQHASCRTPDGSEECTGPGGRLFEAMAGVKLQWATAIPIVPYAKLGAGLVFAYPDGHPNGLGPAARVGGGANYFFFDWLGLGVELGVSVGHLSIASSSYSIVDFGGGVELMF